MWDATGSVSDCELPPCTGVLVMASSRTKCCCVDLCSSRGGDHATGEAFKASMLRKRQGTGANVEFGHKQAEKKKKRNRINI